MLIDKKCFISTLTDLWQEVFSDSREYIELIFDNSYDKSILCFAAIEGERAVSAFYLLEAQLRLDGKLFNGLYLYAAATLPSHRSKGLMSELIVEALAYCKKEGLDFISLVPSQESLYGYYSRFGFRSMMYKYNLEKTGSDRVKGKLIPVSAEEYFLSRYDYFENMFTYSTNSSGYAVSSLRFYGFDFYKDIKGDYYLYNTEEDELIEMLSGQVGTLTKEKAGMLCPLNDTLEESLEGKEIYMNIPLD